MDSHTISREFIRRIPKTDLHVHLDGSLRLASLIDMAKADKVLLPSYEDAGLKEQVFKSSYADLPEYLAGFAYTCAVLQNLEHLERSAYELAEDNLAEGVRYIEVRFAPQLHFGSGRDAESILTAVNRGLERAEQAHNLSQAVKTGQDLPFEYGIIVCALRSFNAHMGKYYAQLLSVLPRCTPKQVFAIASMEIVRDAIAIRDRTGLPIVGFDLAGAEAGYPAADHHAAFHTAHAHFLNKTVHAGEAYGPESVFQAITQCFANRIGHGTHLFAEDKIQDSSIEDRQTYVQRLAEYIASRRITIEVCLTSNMQTLPNLLSASDHSLRRMLDHNLSISICTDNRLVSDTTVSDELARVVKAFDVSARQLRNMIIAGFKGSFFPGSYIEKRAYVRKVIDRYEQLESELISGGRSQEE